MTQSSLLRNSLAVTSASGLSMLTSVAAIVLIAGTYGLGPSTDAYFVAIILSNLANMILQVSVNSVLVPAISQATVKGNHSAGEELAQSLLFAGMVVGLGIFALLALGASPLTRILAPGFDEPTWRTATYLFRYAAVGVALAFPSEILRAYLNTRGAFGWPAAAEALRTGAIVVAIIALPASLGIQAAIIGFCAGHALQFALLLALALRNGLRFSASFDLRNPALRTFLRELRYPILGVSANYAPLLLQRFLTSLLPAGTVAVFAIAQQVVYMLFSITLKGVSTAAHPVVSRQAVEDDPDSMNATLVRSLKLSALFGCVVFVFAASLNRDAVALIAGFRSFTADDAAALSLVLLVLCCMLPVNGMAQIARLPYYARNNAQVPAWHMVGMGVVHTLAQLALFYPFGVIGIAWAQVVWVWLTMATCFVLLPRTSRTVLQHSLPPLLKIVSLSLTLGLLAYGFHDAITPLPDGATRLLRLSWMAGLGVLTLAVTAFLYRVCIMAYYVDVIGARGYGELAAQLKKRLSS